MCSSPDIPEPPKRPAKTPDAKKKKPPKLGKKSGKENKRKKLGAKRLTIALGGEKSSGSGGRTGVGVPK